MRQEIVLHVLCNFRFSDWVETMSCLGGTEKIAQVNAQRDQLNSRASNWNRRRCAVGALTVSLVAMAIAPTVATAEEIHEPLGLTMQGTGVLVSKSDGTELEQELISESSAEKISVIGAGEEDMSQGSTDPGELAGYLIEQQTYAGPGEEPLYDLDDDTQSGPAVAEGVEGNLVSTETFEQDKMKPLSAEDFEASKAIAVTENSISLTWELPAGAESTKVLVDGVETSGEGQSFTLEGLLPDSEYQLDLVHFSKGQQEVVRTDTHVLRTIGTANVNPFSDEDFKQQIVETATLKRALAIRYRTFITNPEVEIDLFAAAGCSDALIGSYFSGDNRTFSFPAPQSKVDTDPSSRSILQVKAELEAPPGLQDVIVDTHIGQTNLLDGDKNVMAWKTAPDTGIVVQNPQVVTDSYARFGVSHEVKNPWCELGAIRYTLNEVQIYKSGTITVSGSRVPVPAHELYGVFRNSSMQEEWRILYTGAQGSFMCLLGGCVNESISGNASVS